MSGPFVIVANGLTGPYWRAVTEGRLELPACDECGAFHFYPRVACPACGSTSISWKAAGGTGHIYSYTVVNRSPGEAFADEVPYVLAAVALDEGPHLMTRIVDCEIGDVRVNLPVRLLFRNVGGNRLPVFAPLETE